MLCRFHKISPSEKKNACKGEGHQGFKKKRKVSDIFHEIPWKGIFDVMTGRERVICRRGKKEEEEEKKTQIISSNPDLELDTHISWE